MKCVSFNVNSIRIRLHQLQAVIDKHNPDFIGVQETKVTDEDFPIDAIKEMGYHVAFLGQKTHYGVALLSRHPFVKTQKGFPGDDDTAQKRFVCGEFEVDGQPIVVMNGYFPQGESNEHPTKYPNKRKYYEDLQHYLEENFSPKDNILVIGDMNISHKDIDIGIGDDNRKRWIRSGKCSFLPEEREWLERLLAWGLTDTFRLVNGAAEGEYSWFDYRSKGFEREPRRGLRIDLVLATESLTQKCTAAGIDTDVRAMEKPSDHCPIWSEFKL
ncbi:exodeoxyribonuclease III [Teredinibacter purpureus]|uniref:exodeoxyribonuclease III n=1 Tax=Teredinibacter purpureus TaxID=2731756 RepID=UPI0005F86497|nr:exodeoxyribonuclease III [Teredinibacter purpureus]